MMFLFHLTQLCILIMENLDNTEKYKEKIIACNSVTWGGEKALEYFCIFLASFSATLLVFT